jgi:hypothetical protein
MRINRIAVIFLNLIFVAIASAYAFHGLDVDVSVVFDQSNSAQDLPETDKVARLDYQAHVKQLKKSLSDEFTIVIEKPFVVIGDQPSTHVKKWAKGTIRWAIKEIKEAYFKEEPDHIINIWLFKDKESYEKHTEEIFGQVPTTPYGYYSPSDKALVMNISTGGGTLIHELVHPFVAANFPDCPSWFNEGLASLYEQSSERSGDIVGLTNWRLRGLQFAIKDERLGSFERLMSTDDRGFYDGDATNYAQARYLCYWLQEKGILQDFYHGFVRNYANDPTGKERRRNQRPCEIPRTVGVIRFRTSISLINRRTRIDTDVVADCEDWSVHLQQTSIRQELCTLREERARLRNRLKIQAGS